ncbi:hypothetical protein JKF63_03929 [Porcisia hertigi]|uniref:Uncharacterized protein n=1 Tax=Porcisia hertigi TaxID=2761500 RepID=A0A836HU84_9TRYP|nr:hypothetical protein JKF63_03929 [Porcisia hertigi]
MPVLSPFSLPCERESNRAPSAANATVVGYATLPRQASLPLSTPHSLSNSTREPLQQQQQQARLRGQSREHRHMITPAAEAPSLHPISIVHSSDSRSTVLSVVPLESSASGVGDENTPPRRQRRLVSNQTPAAEQRAEPEFDSPAHPLQRRLSHAGPGIASAAAGGAERGEASAVLGLGRGMHSSALREAGGYRRFSSRNHTAQRERSRQGSSSISSLFPTPRDTESSTPSSAQQRGRPELNLPNPLTTPGAAEVLGGRHSYRDSDNSFLVPQLSYGEQREGSSFSSLISGRGPATVPAGAPLSTTRPIATPSAVVSHAPTRREKINTAAVPGHTEGVAASITILVSPQGVQLTTSQDALRRQTRRSSSLISVGGRQGATLYSDRVLGVRVATASRVATTASRTSSLGSVSTWQEKHADMLQGDREDPLTSTQVSCGLPAALWQPLVLTTTSDGNAIQPTRRHYPPSSVSSTSDFSRLRRHSRDGAGAWMSGGGGNKNSSSSSVTTNMHSRLHSTSPEPPLPFATDKRTGMVNESNANPRTSPGYTTRAQREGLDSTVTSRRARGLRHDISPSEVLSEWVQHAPGDPLAAAPFRGLTGEQMTSSSSLRSLFCYGETQGDPAHAVVGNGPATVELMPPRASQVPSQRHDGINSLGGSESGGPLAVFTQVSEDSFSSHLDASLMMSPRGGQQMPHSPQPAHTSPKYTVCGPWDRFTYDEVVSHHTLLDEVQRAGADESSELNHHRQEGREEAVGASRSASPHTASIAESGVTPTARNDSASRAERGPLPQPASRLRLPVAEEGVVLLNHLQNVLPQGELYRLLCLRHREPLNHFPRVFRGPPLAVKLTIGAGAGELLGEPRYVTEWEEDYNNLTSSAGSTDTSSTANTTVSLSLTLQQRGGGRRHRYSTSSATTAASDASMVEVNATHPRELYSRLISDPVPCEVEVFRPAAGGAAEAPFIKCTSVPPTAQRSNDRDGVYFDRFSGAVVLGGHSTSKGEPCGANRSVAALSRTSAVVVANGFYNSTVHESRARQLQSAYEKAVAEYGEASYYSVDAPPMHGTAPTNGSESLFAVPGCRNQDNFEKE